MIRVLHQLRGRARFAVPEMRGRPTAARSLERALARCADVTHASVNPHTGNVLVLFSPSETAERIAILIDQIRPNAIETTREATTCTGGASNGRTCPVRSRCAEEVCGPRDGMGRWVVREPAGAPWHTMEIDALVRRFGTSLPGGLSEAAVLEHRSRFGGNALPGTEARSFSEILYGQVASLPMALSVLGAGLSAATGGLAHGLVILGVAIANIAVGSLTESRAERELETTREAVDLRARVLREGRIAEIPFDEVVPGDILSLQPGSRVPADARVVRAQSLAVDEASLTGESMPVYKTAGPLLREDLPVSERSNMVFRGTLVVGGTGRALVVATGCDTVLGRLQRFLGEVLPPEALMARDLRMISHRIVAVAAAGCGVLGVVSLLRGRGLISILGESFAFFAGAIPTGLSTLAISAFAFGHRDLRRNRVLVRRLRALGNLASIRVVCFDKTGTLTHNRMTARELRAGGKCAQVGGDGVGGGDWGTRVDADRDLSLLIRLSALCNEAHPTEAKECQSVEGSATERSLLELAELAGMNVGAIREECPILEVVHRSEEHAFMVTVHRWGDNGVLRVMKGSPVEVLDRCSHFVRDGETLLLGDEERDAIEIENLKMAGEGFRVLGVACRKDAAGEAAPVDADRSSFVWVGLVGLEDPLRTEAKSIVGALHRAGIRTVVITGDQSYTAQHIGNELGLSGEAPLRIMDASDLRRLDEAGMQTIVTQAHVFARLNPTQKLQIVQAYQRSGLGVAMVGDGFNDVLALKVADVGMAMGTGGAGLARGSADLVLEDDDLQAVMVAIATGRSFQRNMQKSVRFLLTANHMDLLAGLLERGVGIGHGPAMIQALWTNLMCLSLALDPPGLCDLDEGPTDPGEGLLGAGEMEATLLDAGRLAAGAAIAGSLGALAYGPGQEAARLFMQSASVNQILHGTACRAGNGVEPDDRPRNTLHELTLVGSVGAHLLGVLLPVLGGSLGAVVSGLFNGFALGVGGLSALFLLRDRKSTVSPDEPPDRLASSTHRHATSPAIATQI